MMRRAFRIEGPFDFASTLAGVTRGRFDPSATYDGRDLWRATRTLDGPGTEHVYAEGDDVVVEAWGPGAAWLIEHAPALVGAHDDPTTFEPHHPLVREMHRRRPGMRQGRTGAVVEALVPSIIEQKVPTAEALPSYARLVRRYGDPAPGPRPLRLPPDPKVLAGLPYWAFHPLGIERKRADTVRRACTNAKRMEEAASMEHADASRRLQAIPGIGPWTAAEVGRVALGDPDAVSVGDYHLKNVVAYALAGEERATDERMLELLEPYRGQRARAVRLIEASGVVPPRRGPRMTLRKIAAI